MARIAALSEYYLPGFAGGGTIVSLSRIVEEEPGHEIRVLTNDHDLGSGSTFPGVDRRQWQDVGRAKVAYLHMCVGDLRWAVRELRRWHPDAYYVNSLQSPEFTLLPLLLRRMRLLPQSPVIVAPRGECGTAALAHKGLKKTLARPLIRWLIGKKAVWQASSDAEATDIKAWYQRALPPDHDVIVRADPPPKPSPRPSDGSSAAVPVVLFASRIDQMKGLDLALKSLRSIKARCTFIVTGAISDPAYWAECQELAEQLPSNVAFVYAGPYTPDQTIDIFSSADVLLLPTRGENFGHAIAEALSVGCPVVTSTQTIWTSLINSGGGNAGSMDDNSAFLESLLSVPEEERRRLRRRVHDLYMAWYQDSVPAGSFFTRALG